MIGVAMKWVGLRPDVDTLTGRVEVDERFAGASAADLAALEWAVRLGEGWREEVVAVAAGPAAAEPMLRAALSAGAARAVRIEIEPTQPSDVVAGVLAGALTGATAVVCGDWSLDRGSGSVPPYLAGHLGAAAACGLVGLQPGAAGQVTAERRLDGGRRERLVVRAPMVLSVEGASARLRRAPLAAVLASQSAPVEVVQVALAHTSMGDALAAPRPVPFRPPPRELPGPPTSLPARDRIAVLSGLSAGGAGERGETGHVVVTLAPEAAADRLLDELRAWGYLR